MEALFLILLAPVVVALAFTVGVAYVLVHFFQVDLASAHQGVWIFLAVCFGFFLSSASST